VSDPPALIPSPMQNKLLYKIHYLSYKYTLCPLHQKKGGRGRRRKINRKQKERQKYKEKTNCKFDLCITASLLSTCLAERMSN